MNSFNSHGSPKNKTRTTPYHGWGNGHKEGKGLCAQPRGSQGTVRALQLEKKKRALSINVLEANIQLIWASIYNNNF